MYNAIGHFIVFYFVELFLNVPDIFEMTRNSLLKDNVVIVILDANIVSGQTS